MKRHLAASLAAFCTAAAAFAAQAQDWPAKPVTILVPFAAGGTVDIVARTLGQKLAADLGKTFVVENRAGAGGSIATTAMVRAAPDGYTLLFHHQGIVFNAALYDLPFDTTRDVMPVAYIGATPNVLVVNKNVPAASVQEFLALARARPGAINYGSGGVGSAGHLSVEMLQSMAGLKLQHIPYKGSGPAIADLIGGRIQAMLLTIPAVMPYLTGGDLRPIATSGKVRSPALPNLPTLAESGITDFDYTPWYGVFAPAGTPAPVLRKIHEAINNAISDPEMRDKLAKQGLEVQPMTREEFAAIMSADVSRWTQVIKALGIKGE